MRMIDDKEAYIKEIQRFLMKIYPDTGIAFESGIYDEQTKRQLRRFKNENSLSDDTVVDLETFGVLYTAYKAALLPKRRTMVRGDRGDDVQELNKMLNTVGAAYFGFERLDASSYYSEKTERGVRYMREKFLMEDLPYADSVFYERLKTEYDLTREEEIETSAR